MKTDLNLANAVLILGTLFFIYKSGFNWWVLLLIFFAVGVWSYQFTDKKVLELQKLEIEAKIKNTQALNAESVARTLNLVESTKYLTLQRLNYLEKRK